MTHFKALLIDSGHGKTPTGAPDSGATGNGTTEREQVKEIAARLVSYLSALPIEVFGVGVDEDLSIGQHIQRINGTCNDRGWGPQDVLLVSIHMNAAAPGAHGVEAWYGMHKTSDLAVVVAEALANETGLPIRNPEVDPSNKDRLGRLGVLDDTIPANACLIECGFVTNAGDVQTIINHKHEVVLGIARGICQFLSLPMPPIPTPTSYSDVPADAWYKPFVDRCLAAGIFEIPQDGLFHPEAAPTRAELAAMFARLLNNHS